MAIVKRVQARINFMTVIDIFLFLYGFRKEIYCMLCYASSHYLNMPFILFTFSHFINYHGNDMVCP